MGDASEERAIIREAQAILRVICCSKLGKILSKNGIKIFFSLLSEDVQNILSRYFDTFKTSAKDFFFKVAGFARNHFQEERKNARIKNFNETFGTYEEGVVSFMGRRRYLRTCVKALKRCVRFQSQISFPVCKN